MSRRDSDANPTREDASYGISMRWTPETYFRLRCLEVAVKTFDPDGSIDTRVLVDVAQALMQYIQTGDAEVFHP